MKVSRSLSDIPKPPLGPSKPAFNQTLPEDDSPYRIRLDPHHRKPASREWRPAPSGALPFSADQVSSMLSREVDLPSLAGYLPPFRERQWTSDQLKFIDK